MTKDEPRDTTCLVCGHTPTSTGFICRPCYNERLGTVHPNWTNATYWQSVTDEAWGKSVHASEARFALKQQQRQNRFTREEISA